MAITNPVAATPMAFVRAILHAYHCVGMDPSQALARAQIGSDQVAIADARITAWQMEQISDAAMRELDDEALGWFSRRLPWGSYGMLARASISAPTLGVALKRWCRHHGLIAPDIALELGVTGDVATIRIKELSKHTPALMREFCLVSVLRNVHGLACWLVDSRIALLGAQFPFSPPAHVSAYPILFSGPITFGTDTACIRFDAQYLALPLRRDENALRQMLQHALPLTVLQYRRDRLLVQRVRQTLATDGAGMHNAQTLALLLHVSARTLHRQLKEEGATLQGLKDEARHVRAMDLLRRTQRPIKQVAEAAGFRNEKSFIRAFKAWTGQSPGDFRRHGGTGILGA